MPSTSSPRTLGSGPLSKLANGTNTTYDVARVGAGLGRGPSLRKKSNAAAWSNTWPAPQATLDLDFANDRGFVRGVGQGKSMDAVTFTRASSANWVDSTGTLITGAGTFPGTSNALGNNLLTFPQNFENAVWLPNRLSVISKAAVAPDQTLTMSKLQEDTNNNSHALAFQLSVTSGVTYTFSIYAAFAGRQYLQLAFNSAQFGPTTGYATFDLINGSVSQTGASATASISNVGNGIYRCVVTSTCTSTAALSYIYAVLSNVAAGGYLPSYTGDNISGAYIWGAQLEVGSSATTYYPTNINVPRFDWASTAQVANKNLMYYTEDFGNAGWTKSNTTITVDAVAAPNGTTTADKLIANTTNAGHAVSLSGYTMTPNVAQTISIYAQKAEYNYLAIIVAGGQTRRVFDLNAGTIGVSGGGLANTAVISNEGGGWYRCSITFTPTAAVNVQFNVQSDGTDAQSFAGTGTSGIYIWGAQLELGSSVTTYQPIAQPTTNTPLAANPTCNGLLIEESRANRLLWCRDATNAAWTKTNVTAAKDQTGIDGVANAASSLTASANGGTCIQTITLASGARTGSVYLKRITGTGNVQVTLDNSTWSTVDLSNGLWNRIVLSGTVTNPTVGILLATNGDAVAMDYGQIEDGAFATSPILTTTASVTRSADLATVQGANFAGFYNQSGGTIGCNFALLATSGNLAIWSIGTRANSDFIDYTVNYTANFSQTSYVVSNTITVLSRILNTVTTNNTKTPSVATFSSSILSIRINNAYIETYSYITPPYGLTLYILANRLGAAITGYVSRIYYIPKTVNRDIALDLSP